MFNFKTLIMLIALSTISVFTFSGYLSANTKADGAKIVFAELKYDFGKVKEGGTLEHIFTFTNDGENVLIINSVQAGCGCTGVIMSDKKDFKPGEEGEIKVTFNTLGRAGVNEKTVTVTSNDPANNSITLTFVCEILEKKNK